MDQPSSSTAEEIAAAVAALWLVVSVVVRLTPSKRDDHALARIARVLSFLSPPGSPSAFKVPGTPARVDVERESDTRDRNDGRNGEDGGAR